MSQIIFMIGALIFTLSGAAWLDSASCEAKTKNIGMNHDWGIMSGCLVQDPKTNAWVPLENYRNID